MDELNAVPSAVLDALTEGMVLTDWTGAILLVNREAQEIVGREASELIGQPLEALIPEEHDATRAVELCGYLDTMDGRFTRRRYKLTGDTWRGQFFPRGPASRDRRMRIVSIRDLSPDTDAGQAQLYDRRLKSLREIGRTIRSAQAPDVAARIALRHIRRLVPCAQAVVLVFDLEAAEAMVLAALPTDAAGTGAGARLPLHAVEFVDTLRRGRPHVVEDSASFPQPPPSDQVFRPADARSFVSAPLVAGGRLIGALAVAASEPNALERRHVIIACEVADQLAIAIQSSHLLQQVRAHSERLRALSRQLMEIQENERRRIARELHDEIGQSLTAVKINLETILRLPDRGAVEPHLEESIAIVDRVLGQVRTIALDLRPSMLDDLGLESTLRWYLGRQADRGGFTAELIADAIEGHLPHEVKTACFRVAQEALANVARHAHARHVQVELRQRGATLRVVVSDDGVGFDPREAQASALRGAHLGLLGIEERVRIARGELAIESAPGRGTIVRADFPLRPDPADSRE